jgi:hypothetical protein
MAPSGRPVCGLAPIAFSPIWEPLPPSTMTEHQTDAISKEANLFILTRAGACTSVGCPCAIGASGYVADARGSYIRAAPQLRLPPIILDPVFIPTV